MNREIQEKSPFTGCISRVFDPTTPRISISRFYPLYLDASRGSDMGLDSRKLETEPSRQDRAARRRAQRPAHRADRRVRSGRRFSEPIVRAMAECNKRPVIFPLSNPTSREEATTADIEAWTEGRTLIGVGSPFPPIMRDGSRFKVDQTNNSYIFPVSTSVTITVWLCPARPRSIERAAWIRTTSARDRFVAWVRPYSLGSPSLKSRGCVHTHRMMRLFVLFVVEPCIRTRANPL